MNSKTLHIVASHLDCMMPQQPADTTLGTPIVTATPFGASLTRDAAVRDSLGDLRKKAVFLAEVQRHFYYQKTKIHFLKQGDRNTKFFHEMVKRNAARNSILAITKNDGSIITSVPDIAQEFIAFYTSLLGTEDQTWSVDDDVFEWGPMLSSEHASDLCRAVTPAEVKLAVF
ncbi:UNVERIFIED_CONTAM: hypothetical protein Slati_2129200 [Sesamum latifolium]|uniref:Uncharacterized protein n=1 Tax=Sesamum latifolium TaxID=2727402 RepID=A0AAW2WRN1_9LAMI